MFEEIRLLKSSSSTFVSSLRLPTSQTCYKLKKTAQSFLKEIVNVLFNGLKEPDKVSEKIVLQVRLDSSFAVLIAMCKASKHTLMQLNKSNCL